MALAVKCCCICFCAICSVVALEHESLQGFLSQLSRVWGTTTALSVLILEIWLIRGCFLLKMTKTTHGKNSHFPWPTSSTLTFLNWGKQMQPENVMCFLVLVCWLHFFVCLLRDLPAFSWIQLLECPILLVAAHSLKNHHLAISWEPQKIGFLENLRCLVKFRISLRLFLDFSVFFLGFL